MNGLRRGRKFPVVFPSFLFLVCMTQALAAEEGRENGTLDGTVFLVEKGKAGKPPDGKDTYIFRNGRFRSRLFEKEYGFEDGTYAYEEKGGTIVFTADIRSPSNGTVHWEGTVTNGDVDVRYTWTGRKPKWFQESPEPSEYWGRSVTTWPTKDPGPPGGGSISHLLDGRTFLVKSGEQGKEASHHDDYLIFRDGMFVSSDCAELLNFRESSYSAITDGEEIRFQAETTSPTHGSMIWNGAVRGNIMDATARWIDKRWYWTIDRMYWFRGKLLE